MCGGRGKMNRMEFVVIMHMLKVHSHSLSSLAHQGRRQASEDPPARARRAAAADRFIFGLVDGRCRCQACEAREDGQAGAVAAVAEEGHRDGGDVCGGGREACGGSRGGLERGGGDGEEAARHLPEAERGRGGAGRRQGDEALPEERSEAARRRRHVGMGGG